MNVGRRTFLEIAAGAVAAASAGAESGAEHRPSPPLTVYVAEDKKVVVERLKGRVILLDFMTTTGPSCKKASLRIQNIYRELRHLDFIPVGVALNFTSFSALESYRCLNGLTFPLGAVSGATAAEYLRHPPERPIYVPVLVTIDRDLQIREQSTGWDGEDEVRHRLPALLAE